MRSRPGLSRLFAGFSLWALLGAMIWAFAPVPGIALDGRTSPERDSSVVLAAPAAMASASTVLVDRGGALAWLRLPIVTGGATPITLLLGALFSVIAVRLGDRPDSRPFVPAFLRRGPPVVAPSLRLV
jgi:hypothetical protein